MAANLSQTFITPIKNTVGLFLHEEGTIKLSNSKWTLLVYKELLPVKNAISKNDRILDSFLDTFVNVNTPRMIAFKGEIQTHISLLKQISNSVNLKYQEIMMDTPNYNIRQKRGLINGIGTIWKTITGNLDSSDGEYFNDCIEKVSRDERHLETLMKNQISVTTSVIKNFNSTIQKLQIDEETFNKDVEEIQKSIMDISDDIAFYAAKVGTLDLCESLMESYAFLENFLNDVINAITFARLKILHSSIITPLDLINSLRHVSQSLHKNNLPLPAYSSSLAKYLDIIELEAYQSDSKVIFVLRIPLVEPDTYTLYHVYPIPILDNRTGLHHIIPSSQKYIARSDDSMLYVSLNTLENCKTLGGSQKICSDVLPYPIDSDSICEAQLLKQSIHTLPRTCETNLLFAKEYNVQEIDYNLWLITVSDPLPTTIKCNGKEPFTKIINDNSLFQLQPGCNGFIGSTRVHAKYRVEVFQNITYKNLPIQIPFECCEHLPKKSHMPDIKPLHLNKINVEDLNIAQHKLDQYSEELDKIMNEPLITKHVSWFTITTIVIIVALITIYILTKCRRRRTPMLMMSSPNDSPPAPRPPKKRSVGSRISSILPKRRPSIRIDNDIEEEIQLQTHS